MNYKYLFPIAACLIIFFGLTSIGYLAETTVSSKKIDLEITPNKSNYLLGEMLTLSLGLTNKGNEKVSVINNLTPSDGYLKVFVSRNGSRFEQYKHTGWGKANTKRNVVTLSPAESINNSVSIFWNQAPNTEGLNPNVAKKATDEKILTSYAFPEAGVYVIKATLLAYFPDQPIPAVIESKPIQIVVDEPTGENLEIWNKIKNNGDFAYFIQEGDVRIPTNKIEERNIFLKEVEQILTDYPGSFYAESLRRSLTKFRDNEIKIQEK